MNRRSALLALAGSIPALRASDPARVPVLVELFTSEGCSSCPPADSLLIQLERQPLDGIEIIALSEHVDYWNHLGWADAFSSPVFSLRQKRYAERLKMESVYTPEMFVNGSIESLGSDPRKVFDAIQKAARSPRAWVRVEREDAEPGDQPDSVRLRARVEAIPADFKHESFDIVLAIAEDNLSSQVHNGENAGRLLRHAGVVRSMASIAQINPGKSRGYSATLQTRMGRGWNRSHTRAVLFLEGRDTHATAGVASCRLS